MGVRVNRRYHDDSADATCKGLGQAKVMRCKGTDGTAGTKRTVKQMGAGIFRAPAPAPFLCVER